MLTNALERQRIAPAYLFTGARGTGKTSSARILAKSLNCLQSDVPTATPCGTCAACRQITQGEALDVIEIDAASNTGVDHIRHLIEQAQFQPMQCRYKVYVIDECHMLSASAFSALLKTLEEPPDRVVFVLATTDPQKVLPTIVSRCQQFDFRRIPFPAIVKHLTHIAQAEGIAITDTAVTLIAQTAQGGLRDAETLLDQLSLLNETITPQHVWQASGGLSEPDLLAVLSTILQPNRQTPLAPLRALYDQGRTPVTIVEGLLRFLTDLQQLCATGSTERLYASLPDTVAALKALTQLVTIPQLQLVSVHLTTAIYHLRQSTQPTVWLERTVLDLTEFVEADSTVTLVSEQTVDQNELWQTVVETSPSNLQRLLQGVRLVALNAHVATLSATNTTHVATLERFKQSIEGALQAALGYPIAVQVRYPLDPSPPLPTACPGIV